MVGLLIVSHSANAAEGIREIAVEMGDESAGIVAVGGAPGGGIGTSADAIRAALESLAATADGIVVLADLGSAVMNAEQAIEDLDVDIEIVVADGPILEGALNAAVAAAGPSATVESVRESAEAAAG